MFLLLNLRPNSKDMAGSYAWVLGGSAFHTRPSRCMILPILGRKGAMARPCDPLAKHQRLHIYSVMDHKISLSKHPF